MTATEIGWRPVDRDPPPQNESVHVLYADGVQVVCKFAGKLPLMEGTGLYRYVEAKFWRPLKESDRA